MRCSIYQSIFEMSPGAPSAAMPVRRIAASAGYTYMVYYQPHSLHNICYRTL